MRKNFKVLALMIAAGIVLTLTGCTNKNITNVGGYSLTETSGNTEKQLPEELAVYIDCSSSITEDEAEKLKAKALELANGEVSAIFTFSDSHGGEDTEISLPLKWAAQRGHNRIVVLTDGENWPKKIEEELKGLDLSFMEIRIICIKKDKTDALLKGLREVNSEEFSPFQKSTVKVEYLDGSSEELVRDEYHPVAYQDSDTLYKLSEISASDRADRDIHSSWWWWLLLIPLLILIPLLLGFLIWRRKKDSEKSAPTDTKTDKKELSEKEHNVVETEKKGITELSGVPIETPKAVKLEPQQQVVHSKCCCCCCSKKNNWWPATVALIAFMAFLAILLILIK